MNTITDTIPEGREDLTFIRPFSPIIVKQQMSEEILGIVENAFSKAFDDTTAGPEYNLAGNMKREFTIDQTRLGEVDANKFIQMLANGGGELYKASKLQIWENMKKAATSKHIEMIENNLQNMQLNVAVHQAWGNISGAGAWNPVHRHSGMVSGVGYIKLPDDIEFEWENEDHDPSAGMIQFTDSRSQDLSSNNIRLRPEVGVIYFFPAWLMHMVYPFRSKGERWSFSFNLDVKNQYPDIQLTDAQKMEMIEHREKLIAES